MPLYEYVLRQPGRTDEHLITEVDSHRVGDTVEIRNRRWVVVAVEQSSDPNVAERKLLEPLEVEL